MSRRLATAVRLVVTVQGRAKFPHVYFGMTVVVVIVLRLVVPDTLIPLALPVFLFGEPGSLGVVMVAAQRYLERGERSVVALVVTPLRSHEYVAALVLGSAIVPTVATAIVQAGVQGVDLRALYVMPPVFLIAVISGCIGLLLSTIFKDFTRFLLGCVPPVVIYSLPAFSFVGLTPNRLFVWLPSDAALRAFGMIARDELRAVPYVRSLAVLVVFAVGLGWVALLTYAARVRRQVEFV